MFSVLPKPENPWKRAGVNLLLTSLVMVALSTPFVVLIIKSEQEYGPSLVKEAHVEADNLSRMVEQYMTMRSPLKLPESLEDLTTGPNPVTMKIHPDPWGQNYVYVKTGERTFLLMSLGPDGQFGTADDITAGY